MMMMMMKTKQYEAIGYTATRCQCTSTPMIEAAMPIAMRVDLTSRSSTAL